MVPVQGEAVALPERARLRVDDGAAPRQLVVVEHVEVVGAAALGVVRVAGAELEGDAVVEAGGGAGVGLVADVRPDAPHGFGRVWIPVPWQDLALVINFYLMLIL